MERCEECVKHEGLSKDFYALRRRVQDNEDFYKPVAERASLMMKDYPSIIQTVTEKVAELDKQNILENSKLDAIHDRMDKHDEDEQIKRQERREDRAANRNNTLTILVSIAGVALSFGIWLVQAHEATEVRLMKIEQVLGIGQ